MGLPDVAGSDPLLGLSGLGTTALSFGSGLLRTLRHRGAKQAAQEEAYRVGLAELCCFW